MSARDDRYNRSRKGQARLARFETTKKRRAYRAAWMRRFRAATKRAGR